MRKTITILSLITLAGTQACVAQKNVTPKKEKVSLSAMPPQTVHGYYEWSVTTDKGTYEGTTPTWENVEKIIDLAAKREIILGRKIVWVPINVYKK